MIKITIDGKIFEVDPKMTILQAAKKNGIHIPHFCWHPKLSISGNCRICLVEVENNPKLVISCATQVVDGMVVRTKSEKVIQARNAVMEFILINHPLDCPICDEAGECKLQDYAYKYSIGASRFKEDKVRKPKRVELGPHVLLDVERCIMCSRCIRFSEEIANQKVLTFTERGSHVELTTFPNTQLDNPYSMNVVDICPVGALTSRHFRFKARVWEMSSTESICIGCARGCNINIWVRNNEILRLTPRLNENVNSYWMCDDGRINSFKIVGSENRVNAPMIRKDGHKVEVGWDEAIAKVVSELRTYKKQEIAAIASAHATNEENYVFAKFIKDIIGSRHIGLISHNNLKSQDDFLIRADKSPNKLGATLVGAGNEQNIEHILKEISNGTIKLLYVIDEDIFADEKIENIISNSNLEVLIVHSALRNKTTAKADIVLASATFAEKDGTFTNFQGYVQKINPAITLFENDRATSGMSMSRLDKFAAPNDSWGKGIKRDARPTWKIISAIASALGKKLKFNSSEEVFVDMALHIKEFKGMSYKKIGKQGMKILD